MTMAGRIMAFIKQLDHPGTNLSPGIRFMNPYQEYEQAIKIAETFYHKFYDDDQPRHLILGINPGRFGGGVTGIPFTDPKRLYQPAILNTKAK